MSFFSQLKDFFSFVIKPSLSPRGKYRIATNTSKSDWLSGLNFFALLKWALFLWCINLVVLGPIAVSAATAGNAQHKLDISMALPWLQALIWAPIIEELVFRYSLRRINHAIWILPIATIIMFSGPSISAQFALLAIILLCWWPAIKSKKNTATYSTMPAAPTWISPNAWKLRKLYVFCFPFVFHIASLAFAAVHLHNFNLKNTPLTLLPLLVLPQWITGLVLGWLRIRYGIGASIGLHALFNSGPLFVVWLILQLLPAGALQ